MYVTANFGCTVLQIPSHTEDHPPSYLWSGQFQWPGWIRVEGGHHFPSVFPWLRHWRV